MCENNDKRMELNEEQLKQAAGGSYYQFCCSVCMTPLETRITDNELLGFCPTCNCYPKDWKSVSIK